MSSRITLLGEIEKELTENGDPGKLFINLVNLTGREVDEGPRGIDRQRALNILEGIWKTITGLDFISEFKEKHERNHKYALTL